jgi:hypothetical protein
MRDAMEVALLSGDAEELHLRAARVLERCGLFVFDSHTSAEAIPIARALHDLDLLVLAPSDGRAEALELLSLCDEWPALRVIVLVAAAADVPLRGTDLRTLPRDFRDDELREMVETLLARRPPSEAPPPPPEADGAGRATPAAA